MLMTAFKRLCLAYLVSSVTLVSAASPSPNQTQELSPVLQNAFDTFQLQIVQADFSLPNGLQSYAWASYNGQWLFLAGRTNGLHDFSNTDDNFPPTAQNTDIYVVNPATGTTYSRSLYDPSSGLTQEQIDTLSVTSPQSEWNGDTLYITGGYGVITATGQFSTKDTLTAINIPGLMSWVINPSPGQTAAQYIRQISDPVFQITGGDMFQIDDDIILLVFGQNFTGFYFDESNGMYSEQVRRFRLKDDGVNLDVKFLPAKPDEKKNYYRRRDLNIVPAIFHQGGSYQPGLIAFAGVFTLDTGVWTVPVEIDRHGKPHMEKPHKAFKQAMNHYQASNLELFSKKSKDMYSVLFGGISYGFIQNGAFQVDEEIPFINEVTTIKRDNHGNYTQYLMNSSYPVILSTQSNPGNQLLFGAGSHFFMAEDMPVFSNGVVDLDALGANPTVIGYIVGGIQSTLPNTNVITDSTASSYIFKVTITPTP